MSTPYLHIVLVTFHATVPQAKRAEMRDKMASLGAGTGGRDAGILFWKADWNLDQRKNYHLMETGIFSDEAAFRRFHADPAHTEFAAEMSHLADWVVGDMNIDLAAVQTHSA